MANCMSWFLGHDQVLVNFLTSLLLPLTNQILEELTCGSLSVTSYWTQSATQASSNGRTVQKACSASWSLRQWPNYGERRKTTAAWPMRSSVELWGKHYPQCSLRNPNCLSWSYHFCLATLADCTINGPEVFTSPGELLFQVLLQERDSGACGWPQAGV